MSLRRTIGSLLTWRFSPRAIPGTAPARSLHSLRDLPMGNGLRGAAGVAAAALTAGGAFTYFKKGPDDDESAAREKEEAMKARFEAWVKKYDRKYRDEEEKAMRFQVFKETIKWIESKPPSHQELLLPENCFADLKPEELPSRRSCIDIDEGQEQLVLKFLTVNENGEEFIWTPAVKQDGEQATQVSAENGVWRVGDMEVRREAGRQAGNSKSLPRTLSG